MVIISLPSYSQVPVNYEILNYMAAQRPNPDPEDDEAVKKQFQAYFVREVFLNNVFQTTHLFYGEDNNSEYGLVNEMMSNQFADYLVENEFLDLSHIGEYHD